MRFPLLALALVGCAGPTVRLPPVPVAAAELTFSDFYDSLSSSPNRWTELPYMSVWWSIQAEVRHDDTWLRSLEASGRVRAVCDPKCPEAGHAAVYSELYLRANPHHPAAGSDTLLLEAGIIRQQSSGWSSVWRQYVLARRDGEWLIVDRSPQGYDH